MATVPESSLEQLFDFVWACYIRGENLYVCGNGGLYAVAQHLVVDWVKGASEGITIKRLKAEQLGANGSLLSAWANDHKYGDVYKEELASKERGGNFRYNFIPMSCSGNSENILTATEQARRDGANIFRIVGFNGGDLFDMAPGIHIPSMDYGIVEDCTHSIMHWLMKRLRFELDSN